MNEHMYISWEIVALAALGVLQLILIGISGWVLVTILSVKEKAGKISGRVAHVESHLENNPIDGAEFTRL